jgi:hypothetical protein
MTGAISLRGDIMLTRYEDSINEGGGFGIASEMIDSIDPESAEYSPKWIFELQQEEGRINLIFPYWCVVLLAGMFAAAPWVRFSLRALLVATTLVAVVLGLVVYFAR